MKTTINRSMADGPPLPTPVETTATPGLFIMRDLDESLNRRKFLVVHREGAIVLNRLTHKEAFAAAEELGRTGVDFDVPQNEVNYKSNDEFWATMRRWQRFGC